MDFTPPLICSAFWLVCCTHLALKENRTTRASANGQDFKSASFYKLSEATRHIPISLLRQGLRPRLALNLCLPRTEIADMRRIHPVYAVQGIEPDALRVSGRHSVRLFLWQLCWRAVDTAEFNHDHGPQAFLEQQGEQKGQSPRRYQVTISETSVASESGTGGVRIRNVMPAGIG